MRRYRQVEPTVTWSAPRAQADTNAQDAALKSPCELFELRRCELASLATSSGLQTSEALLLAVVQRHSDRNRLGVSSRQAGGQTDRHVPRDTVFLIVPFFLFFFFKSGISVVLFLSISHFLYLPLAPAPFQQSAFQQFFTVSLSLCFSVSDPFVSCCWQILAETWSLGAALLVHSQTWLIPARFWMQKRNRNAPESILGYNQNPLETVVKVPHDSCCCGWSYCTERESS